MYFNAFFLKIVLMNKMSQIYKYKIIRLKVNLILYTTHDCNFMINYVTNLKSAFP